LDRRMWNAIRCALLPPIPGSFFSSSISRAIGSANLATIRPLESGKPYAAQHSTNGGLHGLVDFLARRVYSSSNQVLKHLDVSGFASFGIHADFQPLFASIHLHGDRAAAGRRFHHSLLHLFLQTLRLLLRLLEHLLKLTRIETAHAFLLTLVAMVNHGTNLGAEFFLHALHHRVFGRAAARADRVAVVRQP